MHKLCSRNVHWKRRTTPKVKLAVGRNLSAIDVCAVQVGCVRWRRYKSLLVRFIKFCGIDWLECNSEIASHTLDDSSVAPYTDIAASFHQFVVTAAAAAAETANLMSTETVYLIIFNYKNTGYVGALERVIRHFTHHTRLRLSATEHHRSVSVRNFCFISTAV